MSDAHGSKNDGDEPVEEQSAPASDDTSAPEQAQTDGSADEPLFDAAADNAAADNAVTDAPASGSAIGSADGADVAAAGGAASEPDITRRGPEPRTTEFSANGADGVDDAAPATAPSPVNAERRGEDTAPEASADEPDYEALAAELDRLEADTAAAAPVAPGAPEPAATADPWFEPASTETFSASEPAPTQAAPVDSAPASQPPAAAVAAPGPIFVQAPEPPRKRGNRGASGLIGLVAALAFAVLFAAASYAWELYQEWAMGSAGESFTAPADFATEVLLQPPYWFTVLAFWLSFWLLGVFVNRARWWSWVVLGLIVGLLTYIGQLAGTLLDAPFWNLTSSEGVELLGNSVFAPLALLALILAREVTIWFGAWVSRRGAKITELNAAEREEYDRVMAEGPKAP